jgi:hypothetical protein
VRLPESQGDAEKEKYHLAHDLSMSSGQLVKIAITLTDTEKGELKAHTSVIA